MCTDIFYYKVLHKCCVRASLIIDNDVPMLQCIAAFCGLPVWASWCVFNVFESVFFLVATYLLAVVCVCMSRFLQLWDICTLRTSFTVIWNLRMCCLPLLIPSPRYTNTETHTNTHSHTNTLSHMQQLWLWHCYKHVVFPQFYLCFSLN